jgi:plasmid segregation protein ParM
MIVGVDIGNYSTKVSNGIIFESKISKSSLLNKNGFTYDGHTYFVGEGTFDTEYRKLKKQNIEILFAYAISKFYEPIKVVVGLPISQYQQDNQEFRDRLMSMRLKNTIDIAVYPEGIGAADSGVIIDIGGRTTDCALIRFVDGQKKIENPISLPAGTLNLYSDFIKAINTRYCLDLKLDDAQDIIRNGLVLDGIKTDIRCIKYNVLKQLKPTLKTLILSLKTAYLKEDIKP